MTESKRSQKSKSSKRQSKKGGKDLSDAKVDKYMKQLCSYLDKNKLFQFWVDIDDKFSNKMHLSYNKFVQKIQQNPNKYIGKTFCEFSGACHIEKGDIWGSKGVLIGYQITLFKVNEDGELVDTEITVSIMWQKKDLEITKVNMKFFEQIMKTMVQHKFRMGSFVGFQVRQVLAKLEKKQIKIDKKVLEPLK